MANKQTRYLRKHGVSVIKTHAPARGNANYNVKENTNASLTFGSFEVYKGQPCPTHFGAPGNRRKSPRKGFHIKPKETAAE